MEAMPPSPCAGPQTTRAAVLPTSPAGSAQGAASGVPPTVGVEEEFILIDSHTGVPLLSNTAVAAAGTALGIDLQLELSRCQIETATPVCARISDLDRELRGPDPSPRPRPPGPGPDCSPPGFPCSGRCAGPPPYFRSARHYDALVEAMLDCGSILDPAMVYWDVRLSAHLPTIEIRISEVPATVHETVLLAILVRALVTTALSALNRGDLARPVVVAATSVWRVHWRPSACPPNLFGPQQHRIRGRCTHL